MNFAALFSGGGKNVSLATVDDELALGTLGVDSRGRIYAYVRAAETLVAGQLVARGAAADVISAASLEVTPFTLPTPVAYWPFDEGSGPTAADASGNGHTATLVHGTWDTSALKKFGVAALKNTDGGYGASIAPMNLTNVHSISFWVNGWDGVNDGIIVGGSTSSSYAGYINATHVFYSDGTSSNQIDHLGLSGSHHLVITRYGSSIKLYKDGIYLNAVGLSSDVPLTVSAISGWPSGINAFAATIDDLRLYNIDLTLAQVQELYALTPPPGPGPVPPVVVTAPGAVSTPGKKEDKFVTITATPDLPGHKYDGGLLIVSTGTGKGYGYEIDRQEAATGSVPGKVYLSPSDPLQADLPAGTEVILIGHKHKHVTPAALGTDTIGVAVCPIPANQYGWIGVDGDFPVIASAVVPVGQALAGPLGQTGAVGVRTGPPVPLVGAAMAPTVSGAYRLVRLNVL